jgi:hypothetical protein
MLNFVTEKPPYKKSGNAIQNTEEWQEFIMAMGCGLKPQEYVTVNFPKEHRIFQQLKDPTNSFITCARYKIKKLGLPYDVYGRNGIVYIVGRGVIS